MAMDVYSFERIMAEFADIKGKLNTLLSELEIVKQEETAEMARLDSLKMDMDAITAEVETRRGIDDSMLALLQQLAAAQTALADQIAALQADAVTQEEIDALQAAARQNAADMVAESARLSAALQANP